MSTTSTPPPDPGQILFQLANGYIISAALQVAAKLTIADRLAHGPQPVAALAKAAAVNEDALYRVLRALAAAGVFQETEPRTFATTPVAELLRSDRPGLRDSALWVTSPFHFRAWSNLMHSVQTGKPASEYTTGMPIFEYFAQDREFSEVFNNAMTAFSAMVIPAVIEAYDFSGIHLLVDVAGGHAQVLTSILQKYPAMHGILMDVDHVIAGARAKIAAVHCQDRCDAVVGDFFTAVPEGGDAYIMKHIIHDWDDERALRILKNIRKALESKASGRVILLEAVIQPGNAPDPGKLLDLQMLVMPGGRERSAEEFRGLFARSGFEMTRIVPTRSPVSVIEARPR